MLPKFLESLGDSLAKEWVAKVLTPACIFWFGGLLAWSSRFGFKQLEQVLTQKSAALPIAQLITGLLVVAVSVIALRQFELPVLRVLEGYWPRWMQPLRRRFVKQQVTVADRSEKRF